MADNDESRDTLVNVGSGKQVSMQVVQDIYSEITGKKEKLTRFLTKNHHATFADINQLNTKIEQMYEQYDVVSSQCSVTLYRGDDQNEQFSSFDRFKLYDSSSSSPIENIEVTYNLLIKLPQIERTQSYKISVNIHSRAAIRNRAKKQGGLSSKFFRLMSGPTGVIEIEYVDYTVARNFFTAINEWVESIESEIGSAFVLALQKWSEHLPFAFRAATTLACCAIVLSGFPPELHLQGTGDIFYSGVLAFGGIYLMAQMAFKAGQLAEQFIDQYQPNSALNLTKGDERLVREFSKSNRRSILKSSLATISVVALNIIAAWAAYKLGLTS